MKASSTAGFVEPRSEQRKHKTSSGKLNREQAEAKYSIVKPGKYINEAKNSGSSSLDKRTPSRAASDIDASTSALRPSSLRLLYASNEDAPYLFCSPDIIQLVPKAI